MKTGESRNAVELIREIRDRMGRRWARMSAEETIEFFKKAGSKARRRARRHAPPHRRRTRAG